MHFLYRVAEHYEDNKMSPGNLGIVFGPTLLRPLVSGDVSMVALLETSYQALLVEFMISHYDKVFGPANRSSTPPPPAPTAPLPETPPRASCPLSSQDPGASSRERPRSLEVRDRMNISITLPNVSCVCFKLAVVMTMIKAGLMRLVLFLCCLRALIVPSCPWKGLDGLNAYSVEITGLGCAYVCFKHPGLTPGVLWCS